MSYFININYIHLLFQVTTMAVALVPTFWIRPIIGKKHMPLKYEQFTLYFYKLVLLLKQKISRKLKTARNESNIPRILFFIILPLVIMPTITTPKQMKKTKMMRMPESNQIQNWRQIFLLLPNQELCQEVLWLKQWLLPKPRKNLLKNPSKMSVW